MSRFDVIMNRYEDIKKYQDGNDYLKLNPNKEKYNFKILAESAIAIHYYPVNEENRKYKRAVAEAVILAEYGQEAFSEAFNIKEKIKNVEKKVSNDIMQKGGAKAAASVAVQFVQSAIKAVWRLIQLLYEHISQFILSFFDLSSKIKYTRTNIDNFFNSLDKKHEKFKSFEKQTFKIDGMVNVKKDLYEKGVSDYSKMSSVLLKSLQDMNNPSGFFASIFKGDRYKFQEEARAIKKRSANVESLGNNYKVYDKESSVTIKGKEVMAHLEALQSCFTKMLSANTENGGSLLNNTIKMREYSKNKNMKDIVEKLKSTNEELDKETIKELQDTIRSVNKLMVELNGNCKTFIGSVIKVSAMLLKTAKKNTGVTRVFDRPKVDVNYDIKYGDVKIMNGKKEM